MNNGLYSIKGGLHFDVNCRQYGHQDKGISPEGAQDQAAFLTAYYMLGQPVCFDCSEVIYPGRITFNDDVLFIITGSPYKHVHLTDSNNISQRIHHACVYEAKKGSSLVLKDREVGFRTLLMAIKISNKNKSRAGLLRGEFHQYFPYWRELNKPIRVFEGSEYHILSDNTFLTSEWQLDKQSNQMGIKLLGNLIPHQKLQMISQPVSDGIIQLSPNGPIVLMRHRQTTGGYPRIACIAEVDIDRLAQIPLGSRITFEKISFDEAMKLKRLQSEAIEKLESDFG
jgi:allophanate hydrolase subunit 2